MNNCSMEMVGEKLTKIVRYKWKLKDEPGQLRSIPKTKLGIDSTYQREWNEAKTRNLAKAWSWIACGALIVACRDSDGLFIVDGQHRWAGAMLRADITHLPCIVFKTDGAREEAVGFLDANTNRKALHSLDKFKAQIIAGDAVAIAVKKMLDEVGYAASKDEKLHGIRCISRLLWNYRVNETEFRAAWPAIVAAANGGAIRERIVDGLVWIEKNGVGNSLSERQWIARIRSIGQPALMEAAARASAYYAKGGANVWGAGMLRVINQRLKIKFKITDE